MRFEEAKAGDGGAVIALWQACGLTRPWNDPQADFDRAIGGPSSAVLLARVEEAVVASVMVGHDGHRGWVYHVSVAPDRQRSGLGRAAMAAATDWLRARGVPKIQLMVREGNAAALAFYEKLGMERQAVVTMGQFLG